ncbi:MAG: hypothetical protein PSV17_03390 [Methylotenera sp.]|nr:hypothetical protein [Methylotenera sp.]MDI1308461.1 hypothetical protein [Methylotenera sp.]
MTYAMLFNQAYALCVKLNSHAIAHDLDYMSEVELIGIVNFLTQLQSC